MFFGEKDPKYRSMHQAECLPSESVVFQRADGYRLVGSDGPQLVGSSEADCENNCKSNTVGMKNF